MGMGMGLGGGEVLQFDNASQLSVGNSCDFVTIGSTRNPTFQPKANTLSKISLVFFVIAMISPLSGLHADDAIKKKVLEIFPQADTNGDGVLSDGEEDAVNLRILERFPQADRNGDGVLSDSEMQSLLRMAATRAKKNPAEAAPEKKRGGTAPSFANVKYGEDERNVFDLWLADGNGPTPLAIYIHGGGFKSGSKEKLNPNDLSRLLRSGISVAAINYRYVTTAPLPAAHHDARRAVQFLRSKADEWNLDKDRVAAFGGSAGAQICMWLAFSDEMANPGSTDPIERESTRLTCVATAGGQTTNDLNFYRDQLAPLLGEKYKLDALSRPLGNEQDPERIRMAMWGASSLEEANEAARSCSALSIISADDPPIFMSYGMSPTAEVPADMQRVRGWIIHHVKFGLALKEKTDELRVEAHLKCPGAKPDYESLVDFFAAKLLAGNQSPAR